MWSVFQKVSAEPSPSIATDQTAGSSYSKPTLKSAESTAAETDWVPLESADEEQSLALPRNCTGIYKQPGWLDTFKPGATGTHDEPTTASAEQADYEVDGRTFLQGDVVIRQGQRELKADSATVNKTQDLVSLEGHVEVRQPDLLIKGARGQVDLVSNRGELEDSSFVIHSAGARGQAQKIMRTENNHILIKEGRFTRCEPGDNFWSLHGEEIDLQVDKGYGTARDVTIKVKDVPVSYFPYLRFPINDERTSGFLTPGFGHDSEGGTDISIPYYFNLAPHYDATYIPRSIWKRGLLNEGQFRFMTARSDNEVNAAFLHEDDVYDDRDLVEIDATDPTLVGDMSKQDRWFVNVRHTGGWNTGLQSTIRFSAVSDDEYFHDIGANVGSAAVAQFSQGIDQSIGNRRTAALDQLGEIAYRGSHWNLAARAQGFQVLDSNAVENYERLPQVLINYRNSISGWQLNLASEYVSFDRDNDELTGSARVVGERFALEGSVSLPRRQPWGFLEPALFFKHRSYQLNDTVPGVNSGPTMSVPGLSIDTGLFFDRSLEIRNRRLQQSLEPRLFLLWVGEEDQDEFPEFDAIRLTPSFRQLFRDDRFGGKDRIGDARQVSVGLTTRVTEKGTGVELLQASVGQIYYFKDRTVTLESDPSGIDNEANQSALFSQVRFGFSRNLRVNATLEWDPQESLTNRGGLSIRYTDSKRRIVNLGYSYTNDEVLKPRSFQSLEESDISFLWPIKGNWNVAGRWNFGWDENQTIESLIGIEYNDCCWRARIAYRRYLKDPRIFTVTNGSGGGSATIVDQRAETGIFFEFQLKGLTTLGRRLDTLLNESVIGYSDIEKRYEH
jgi:LPS-assembly protein